MKSISNYNKIRMLMATTVLLMVSCENDYFPVPPPPVVAKQTATLEAKYVTTPPTGISSSYWTKADYHKVAVTNLSSGNVFGDGLLNMTGTYNGTSGFNSGIQPDITMKAAYDDQKIYILVEWSDAHLDLSNSAWFLNGPADPLKSDATSGWTSQKNNDKLAMAFEILPASSSAGTFSNVGCAASCHNNQMQPQTGLVDIWNWTLGYSEPLGYAADMQTDPTNGIIYDAGQGMLVRNNAGSTDRSGPAYEWDGVTQNVTRPNGTTGVLDPAYYILNKTAFLGNTTTGDALYHDVTHGCYHCHGVSGNGSGDFGDAPPFTSPEVNRYSRQSFNDFATSQNHTGSTYFNALTTSEKEDIIAYIRGFAGVPGYYLQEPTGSNTDISTSSNNSLARVDVSVAHARYKVLLIRKLDTGNPDDIRFNLQVATNYIFGLALMDNDGKNHIGSLKETLTFLAK